MPPNQLWFSYKVQECIKNLLWIEHDFSNRGTRGQRFEQFKTFEPIRIARTDYGLYNSVKIFTNWVRFSHKSKYLSICGIPVWNRGIMQVTSIAECSKGSILQYFRPSLSYHLSLRSLFCLFLRGHLRHVLLYVILKESMSSVETIHHIPLWYKLVKIQSDLDIHYLSTLFHPEISVNYLLVPVCW